MNGFDAPPALKEPRPLLPPPDHDIPEPPPQSAPVRRRGSGRLLLGLGVLMLFVGAPAFGVWRHYEQHLESCPACQQRQWQARRRLPRRGSTLTPLRQGRS